MLREYVSVRIHKRVILCNILSHDTENLYRYAVRTTVVCCGIIY